MREIAWKRLLLLVGLCLALAACSTNPVWGLVDESFYTGQKSEEELQKERETRLAQAALGIAAASASSPSNSPPRTFKYIFLTASIYQGSLTRSDIAEIDFKCNIDANRPDPSATYKALLYVPSRRWACTSANCGTGGSTENTDWVLLPNQEYRRSDGTTVIGTTTSAGIFNLATGSLTNSFATTSDNYWSGLLDDWTGSSSNNCGGWQSSSVSATGQVGNESATDTTSISNTSSGCNVSHSLLCVEQ